MKLGGFKKALPVTLVYEGGWSNNKRDPGGVTLNGIIQRVYDAYRRNKGLPTRPLTPAMNGTADWNRERDAIYKAQYWDAVRGDEVPAGIGVVLFDGAVHSGPFQSIKWLQRSLQEAGLYHDEIDGHFGHGTMAALNGHTDYDALIADMLARRLGMLQHLSTWDAFGNGWTKRVANLKKIGQAWATGSVGPQPVEAHAEGGNAKGYASDVAQPRYDAGDAVKGGIGSGVVTATIDSGKDALAPLVGSNDWVNNLFTILTVFGVLIALGSLGYSVWSNFKSKRARRAIDGELMADVPEGQPA